MQIEWNEKRRNSISCLSPVVSNAGIAPSFYFWHLFLRAPCRRRLDRDGIRIPCPESEETGHLLHPFFTEIVIDIALVGMPAGETCPCVANRTQAAAVLAAGVFDNFFIFHHAVSFLFPNFFRFSMWHLAKIWKLSSRYVCPFSSISCMASFCC